MAGDARLHIRAASLEVRKLSKAFGATRVVSDVSFRVAGGSLLTLLGPSGSGKTTSLRMIAGFEEPTGGQILVADVDITERPAHKRNIGVVFQQYALFPHLTVFQNIAYPLEMRRSGKAEVRRLQQQLGITTVSVTHDQVEALVMSDVIAVMDGGVLHQLGSPLEVYQRPATQFVADFIGESNLLVGSLSEVEAGRLTFTTAKGLRIRTDGGAGGAA